ncbi:MAG: transposase [Dehalococcoidales bacterium]|nr:transposase [Dehalococcoidales bacterium]
MATRIDITVEELHQLQARVDRQILAAQDWPVVAGLVSMLIARTEARQDRLRAKAAQQAAGQQGKQTASGPAAATEESSKPALDGEPAPGKGAGPGEPAPTDSTKPDPPKGHGRNGADAFVHATTHVHCLTAGIIGAICVLCGVGRVFAYRDKVIIRVVGQSLFRPERHIFEQGYCRLCGAIFTATGSELVVRGGIGTSYIIYDWSACAMLIVMHYFAGAPFKRLEALHQGWGVPMPDANQWRIVDECDDLLAPLYRALEQHAIRNATCLRFDDTGSMIIELRRQIHKEIHALESLGEPTRHVRTAINATCLYIETGQAKVVLYFTGRHHAGEIVDRALAHRRASAGKLVAVSDAASKNFSLDHADELEQAVCNAHCYLKFRAIKDKFPAEHTVAGEVYAAVFDNDDKAKALGLDPHQRMLYHREHSKPHMLRLFQMCKDKTDGNCVEPNSPLWEPVAFVINQWPRLTRFYEVPGVPLDTNVVEQALIIPVRYLAGSFAYKTQNGADVGDRHMSFIATANANGLEPVAYLTECLRNHEDLAKRPEYYLPWVYRDRLEQIDSVARPQAPAPTSTSPPAAQPIQHPLRPGTRPARRSNSPPGAGEPQPMVGLGPDG